MINSLQGITVKFIDLVQLTGCCLLYVSLCFIQQTVLPNNYFSIQDIIYYRTKEKTYTSFITRALIIVSIMLISIIVLKFTCANVQIGILIGSFLLNWPSIFLYKLYTLSSKIKIKYFSSCLFSILFTFIVLRVTSLVLIPVLFFNKEFFLLENVGISILYSLVMIIMPGLGSSLFKAIFRENPDLDSLTFDYDLYLTYRRMELYKGKIEEYCHEIGKYSHEYNIPESLLEAVLLLEYINRGSTLTRLFEYITVKIFPGYAINRDFSIGFAQIKISVAKQILKCNPRCFMKNLLDDVFCIRVCAEYLHNIIDNWPDYISLVESEATSFAEDNPLGRICLYIASEYICGQNHVRLKYVFIYATILKNCAYIDLGNG